MFHLLSLLAVLLIVLFVLTQIKEQRKKREQGGGGNANFDFSRRLLFTESEAKFYNILRGLLPDGFEVWGKLGLWAVVSSKNAWGKIAQKQLDFVIVKLGPLPEAVLVVELDDYSHSRAAAQKRDAEKDAILERAGLPLLRVRVANKYDLEDLRNRIQSVLINSER